MKKKLYIDTNVWLDYCLETQDVRPLDEYARHIFERAVQCEFVVCVSEIVEYELRKYVTQHEDLFEPLRIAGKLDRIPVRYADKKAAEHINAHYPDNVHVYIAQKHGCTHFVTNDKESLMLEMPLAIVSSQFFQFE